MTWKNFQQLGYELSEAEAQSLYPEIIRQYQHAKKDITELVRTQYDKYLDAVGSDSYYNEMIKYDRLVNLERQVAQSYSKYSNEAGKLIGQSGEIGFNNNYYRSVYASQWLTESGVIGLLPPSLIEYSVYGTTASWKAIAKSIKRKFGVTAESIGPQYGTLSDLLYRRKTDQIGDILSTITQGLTRGDSYTQMSKSISAVIGTATDGTVTGAMGKAMNIASTEGTRIMNDAAYANSKALESQGINVKKIWIATLDSKTRSNHAHLDGKIKELDAYYIIGNDRALKPGGFAKVGNNARCRCTSGDIINDRSPKIRRGRNPKTGENEIFDYKDYKTWAADNGLKMDKLKVVVA